ncbi:DUF4387 domain-containing protein [Pelagibius litoralis]|uniref:DUF4387 domain-containing protein n=1 Tax=Pelagibius litoralis TaxID=374515 RepID=A0A967F1W4_9PROT|nr:DUF4387 family protein [Pelagibius litoralis]NIA71462.1 DUF4387 domain-containing protein [Pelagibius litoralis]
MPAKKLSELARTIRSKNAGVNEITFDVVFRTAEIYEQVKRSGALTLSIAVARRLAPSPRPFFVESDPEQIAVDQCP